MNACVAPWRVHVVAATIFAAIAVAWFCTSPRDGEFWWSDAPRHALNAVFLADAARDLPIDAPRVYAENYYFQYPALTILFYPPWFYAVAAPFTYVLGGAHWVVLLVVCLHVAVLGWALSCAVSEWAGWLAGLTAGLIMLGLPETAYWGRQIMLEVPALAWVALAYWAAMRLERGQRLAVWGVVLFMAAALYTKISMAAVAPALALSMWRAWRHDTLSTRDLAIAAVVSVAVAAPLAWLTFAFGLANVQSVVGVSDAIVSRRTLAGWLWYAEHLGAMVGYAPLVLGAIGIGWLWVRRRAQAIQLAVWFGVGYVFFSAIDLKEARHAMPLLMPIAIAAAVVLADALAAARLAWAAPAAAFAGVCWMLSMPVPAVDGYREAAQYVAREAPKDTAVLFAGVRDGAFIFNMRAATTRADLWTVRADKLLLRLAIRRELGVEEKAISDEELRALLDRLGVSYVVAQQDFWSDLRSMQRLERVLTTGGQFEEMTRIQLASNVPVDDKVLTIYRAARPVTRDASAYQIELAIIGRTLQRQKE